MSLAIQEAPEECRPATPEEIELAEWAQAARRGTLGTVTEASKRILTLTTALLGGSAAVYNHIPAPPSCKAAAAVCFLVSLGAALLGSLPHSSAFDLSDTVAVKAVRDRAAVIKSRYLWVSSAFLFAGFCVVFGGLLATLV